MNVKREDETDYRYRNYPFGETGCKDRTTTYVQENKDIGSGGCRVVEVPEGTTRFKGEHTRLYPLIGKRVVTPKGAGELWRVFTNSIGVVLDSSSDQVTFFDGPQQIHPLSDTRKLKEKRALLHRSSTKNDR